MDSNMLLRVRSGIRWFGLAAIAAMVGCDTDVDPQVKLDGTGDIEGFLFFDVSEDGLFDPSDGDFAIAGIGITLRDRGTDVTLAGSSTQVSAADGRFSFLNVTAGTHDMSFDTLTIPDSVSICENPVQVSVFIKETRFAEVRGRPGCLITIAEAKDLGSGGDFVVVRGLVTSFPGQVETGRTYIQDATAGAVIFGATNLEGIGIQVGDQIEIGANTGEFSGDFEFLSPVLRDTVQGVDPNPQPDTVTTAALAASGADFKDLLQGRFVRLEKAELVAQFGTQASRSNALIDDGSGAVTIRVLTGVAPQADLPNLFTLGLCYNFQGFGATFSGAGQIFLRSMDAADMEVVACN